MEYTESTQVETNETDENGDPIYETQETPATFVLELGDYDGDTCYARISGSSMVYRVDGTVADTLLAAKGEDLLPQDVVLMDWSDVTSVEINLDGTTYSLEKTVQEETDEDGQHHRDLRLPAGRPDRGHHRRLGQHPRPGGHRQ